MIIIHQNSRNQFIKLVVIKGYDIKRVLCVQITVTGEREVIEQNGELNNHKLAPSVAFGYEQYKQLNAKKKQHLQRPYLKI